MSEQELRAALQAAQAEAASLRRALVTAREDIRGKARALGIHPEGEATYIDELLARTDAGAAFLREREARRMYLERARPILEALLDAALEAGARYDNPSVTITIDPEWAVKARGLLKEIDALSAPAAEPEYQAARGVLPMQPGDERPEDTIRRLRDTEWLSAELSKGAEHE